MTSWDTPDKDQLEVRHARPHRAGLGPARVPSWADLVLQLAAVAVLLAVVISMVLGSVLAAIWLS